MIHSSLICTRLFRTLVAATACALFMPLTTVAKTSSPLLSREPGLPWLDTLRRADMPDTARAGAVAAARMERQASTAEGPPLTIWTDRTLKLIVKYRQNPLRAARSLTYVHVALHDALALGNHDGNAVRRAAAHKAAGNVLAYLYPQETPGRLNALGHAAAYSTIPAPSKEEQQRIDAIEHAVTEAALGRAWQDGADRVWPISSRPPYQDRQWREAPPLRINTPSEGLAGSWSTWVVASGKVLQPPPPPGPEQEAREMDEVLETSRRLTLEQKEIARRWNLDQGTVTPAGVWNKLTLSLANELKLDDESTITVLAAINTGMMDAFIACWQAKFTWWTRRPITALRAGKAPDFMSFLLTPPFPGYVSGHSTISGAASTILAGFFPDRRTVFDAQAEEAALSRLYGGIHTTSDNNAGLALGQAIGAAAVRRRRTGTPLDTAMSAVTY